MFSDIPVRIMQKNKHLNLYYSLTLYWTSLRFLLLKNPSVLFSEFLFQIQSFTVEDDKNVTLCKWENLQIFCVTNTCSPHFNSVSIFYLFSTSDTKLWLFSGILLPTTFSIMFFFSLAPNENFITENTKTKFKLSFLKKKLKKNQAYGSN